jgi:nucleoside-triphosphatase
MSNPHVLLLTGSPGVGKTTLIRKIAVALSTQRLGGFYTEEIRRHGQRQGFRLVTFAGREAVIAHLDFSHAERVSKYGVDVAAIDTVVEEALAVEKSIDIYLVDEIGKMECLSGRFVAAMQVLLDAEKPVVATIAQKGGGFISEVKQRRDSELWKLTRTNRDSLPEKALTWLGKA